MLTIADLQKYDATGLAAGKAGTSPTDKLILYALARLIRPKIIIEVGVSAGHMTAWLAMACLHNYEGRVLSIDNWSGNCGGAEKGPAVAYTRLQDLGLSHLVCFLAGPSQTLLSEMSDESADLVWIDGDHTYAGALADLETGWRVTRDALAAHDTNKRPMPDEADRAAMTMGGGLWIATERGIWIKRKGQQ